MARLRIGVLGGTFDPIHTGHLILAGCAASQLGLERVIFIPAGDPWRKASLDVSPASGRLEMVRLAIAGDERFEVDDSEVLRAGPSYTSDTLREMKARLGSQSQIHFLVGADALEDMRYWHEPEVIFASARLAVARRQQTPVPAAPEGHAAGEVRLPDYDEIDMPYVGISSTDLRHRVRRGWSIRYLVPDAVEAYIKERGLYRE